MKTRLAVVVSLVFVSATVRGQDLATYQSIVNGQNPYYYNTLDNTLVPSAGTGTLVQSPDGSGFTNDYFGNADSAAYFTNTVSQLYDPTGTHQIYNSGVANASSLGSMSLLFCAPNTNANTSTRYIFSNGDGSPNQFYLKYFNTTTLIIGVGNKTITNSTTLTPGTWYYWAATWNFSGANSSTYGINYYLGVAGQATNTLTAGFMQRGGSGNISSTAVVGNGGTFDISGTQAGSGGFQVGGVPGMVDEVATWNTQLSLNQILSQYNTLILVPEPSSMALVGFGGLLLLFARRLFR